MTSPIPGMILATARFNRYFDHQTGRLRTHTMIPRKSLRLPASLVVGIGFLVFLSFSGCRKTEAQRQSSTHVPIHLATGTFDPLSETGPAVLPTELTLRNYPEDEAGYYIVQFNGPVVDKWKKEVASTGARIFDYIPQFAFIVKMDRQSLKAVRAMESIRWIGIYQPGYRIAPDIRASMSDEADRSVEVLVSLFKGEDVSAILSEMNRLEGEIVGIAPGSERIRVNISSKRITDLSRVTGVKWIERIPEFKIFPSIKRRPEE